MRNRILCAGERSQITNQMPLCIIMASCKIHFFHGFLGRYFLFLVCNKLCCRAVGQLILASYTCCLSSGSKIWCRDLWKKMSEDNQQQQQVQNAVETQIKTYRRSRGGHGAYITKIVKETRGLL